MDSTYAEKITKNGIQEVHHEVVVSSETESVDPEVERRCWRKFDMLVVPQLVILILLGYLDRSNIGNARVMGLEKDIGLTGTQFNNLGSFFFVTYALVEIPWALVVKAIGVNRALAIATISWSAVTIGTGFCHNYGQFVACRLLLGLFEGCLAAAYPVYVGNIYPRRMQSKRMASVFYGICLSGACGGLIAYSIQLMGERHGLAAWRWLFIIEGAVSLFFGFVCWISLPASPQTAWFLNAEERAAMAVIRKQQLAYRGKETFEWKYLRMAALDPMVWLAGITGFAAAFPLLGFSLFAPTLILGMGYSRLQANYLSVPLYAAATVSLALVTYFSDKLNRRGVMMIIPAFLGAIGYAIALGSSNPRVGFMAMFFVAAGIYPIAVLDLSWVSNNIAPDSKRTITMPLLMSFTLVSGIMSAQIYPARDAPRYMMGNAISLSGIVVAAAGAVLLWTIWRRRNARKSQLIAEGATVGKYEDDRALGFKYVL